MSRAQTILRYIRSPYAGLKAHRVFYAAIMPDMERASFDRNQTCRSINHPCQAATQPTVEMRDEIMKAAANHLKGHWRSSANKLSNDVVPDRLLVCCRSNPEEYHSASARDVEPSIWPISCRCASSASRSIDAIGRLTKSMIRFFR
jgi:hypothetical protein